MFIPLKMVLIGIDPYPYIYIYIYILLSTSIDDIDVESDTTKFVELAEVHGAATCGSQVRDGYPMLAGTNVRRK
jgi:hypothetical protein